MSNTKEDKLMAHRYLYYVLGDPQVSDHQYDLWEREQREVLAENSPIQGVGSSLESSYSEKQKHLANQYLCWDLNPLSDYES